MSKMLIHINPEIYHRMFEYAKYAHQIYGTEIAGWGHYTREKGIYKLAPLSKQEVSSAGVESETDSFSDGDYDISDMVVQWHSHADMKCHFSSTDEENIRDIIKISNVLISIVVNIKNEYAARLDYVKVGNDHNPIFINQRKIELQLIPSYDNSDVEKEVKEKLTKKEIKTIVSPSYGYGGDYEYGDSYFNKKKNTKKDNSQKNIFPLDNDEAFAMYKSMADAKSKEVFSIIEPVYSKYENFDVIDEDKDSVEFYCHSSGITYKVYFNDGVITLVDGTLIKIDELKVLLSQDVQLMLTTNK